MNQYEEICKDMGQRAKAASFELAQIDQGTLDSALLQSLMLWKHKLMKLWPLIN